MSVARNIKRLREIYDLSQKELGEIAGVSDKAVSTWESGIKEPRMGAIQKIADHFGILKSNIIEDNGMDNIYAFNKETPPHTPLNIIPPKSNSIKVPLYGSISAGIPIEMIEVEEYVEIPQNMAEAYPNAFLLEINGDSMNKLFPSGTYALIDPCEEVENGVIAAVAINGFDATLKRFYKLSNGIVLEPESFNPEHTTQLYDCNKGECDDIRILGRIVWHMPPFNISY